MRLDAYCAQFWPENSRALWQKYILAGYVSVNGETIKSTKYKLDEDDHVTIDIPESPNFENDTLPIIYEDSDVIVINKPAGILTHSKGGLDSEFTVAEFVRPHTSYQKDSNRPGIIHRLDRDTSGVILAVKNEPAAKMIVKQFERRTVKKTYYAVVVGKPKQEEAVIDIPIGRNPRHPSQFRTDPNGKSAQTWYKVVKTTGDLSLVELKPRTGRTHQLRVHLAHIGNPILGDRVYGKEDDRLFLHAYSLELTTPDLEHRTFTVDVPKQFLEKVDDA
ncbi:RluA family pseudouridine synthase [Candidatus Nomurabacteria bacterium]|nr:RluA family pseudouridine synthase [Candidatus Nomurabacteria bacterium]